MKRANAGSPGSYRQRCVVAMVLGTALSTVGPATASAAVADAGVARAVTDINRYCTACWRNAHLHPDCWTDCTQEVLCRLLERVAPDAWDQVLKTDGEERREFLRAIDTVKKRTQRGRKWTSALVETVADPRDRPERRLAEDREVVRQAAEAVLSSRQQRILQLSFEGWSVQDIARELKVPPERVSDEKYKAVHKLHARLGSQN
jgi:RNA polymerase sigma factor (sigma-70 family)